MSEQPFMPLWVADFIGDTLHLSADEVGQYILLLMAMWRAGGSLPADAKSLARIARKRVSEKVLCFFTADGDRLTQKRLSSELTKSRDFSTLQRKKANARWGSNRLKDNDEPSAAAVPRDMPYHTHTHTHKEKVESGADAPPAASHDSFAWQGKVIRLTPADFAAWQAAFVSLDLAAELVARDAWLAEQPVSTAAKRNWFGSTSRFLANRNMEAKAKAQAPPPRGGSWAMAAALERIGERIKQHDDGIGETGTILDLSADRGRGASVHKPQGDDGRGVPSGAVDPFELPAKH